MRHSKKEMNVFQGKPIGMIKHTAEGAVLEVEPEFRPALLALEGFSHINVLWWLDRFDTQEARSTLQVASPYKSAPEMMRIFATRSPVRPNPIALTAAGVIGVDHEKGTILLTYIDADEGTPVLDIKPYTPSIDRVEEPEVPEWCGHWPKNTESSGEFDWAAEFNF